MRSSCWTTWRSSAPPGAGSRSAGWSGCGSASRRRSGSTGSCSPAPRRHFFPASSGSSAPQRVRAEGVAAIADAVVARWFTSHAPSELVDRFREQLAGTPAEGYAGCCEALADADLTRRLQAVAAPTLVLTGSDDPVVSAGDGAALAAAIPNAQHHSIAGAAHLANIEQPEAVTRRDPLGHLNEEPQ